MPPVNYLELIQEDDLAMMMAAERGVPYGDYEAIMAQSDLSSQDWSGILHISERTLQRLRADRKVMDSSASERLLAVAQLLRMGARVLGSPQALRQWIETESPALGGVKPLDFLPSTFGQRLLRDELGRMEHGVWV